MWILVFVVLVPVSGLDRVTYLQAYTSRDECLSERSRIMVEMNKSYPDDTSWTLECRPKGVQT